MEKVCHVCGHNQNSKGFCKDKSCNCKHCIMNIFSFFGEIEEDICNLIEEKNNAECTLLHYKDKYSERVDWWNTNIRT